MFSIAECQALIALGMTDVNIKSAGMFNHEDGGTTYGNARDSKIAWLRLPEDPAIRRVFNTLVEINNKMFDFTIQFRADIGLQFTMYEPGGHYTWHRDWNVSTLSTRKLSAVIQLSDPDTYAGGGLEIFSGHDDAAYKAPLEQGSMLVFPSFMMHRVVPVTMGTRYSLVLWATGPRLN